MLILANTMLIYLVVSLEDMVGFFKKAIQSKLTIQATISEQVKLYQYPEFADFWKVMFYEVVRMALFVVVVTSNNYWYLLAFLLGLAISIWVEGRVRSYFVFLLIYLLINYFWLGLLLLLSRGVLVYIKTKGQILYKKISPAYLDMVLLAALSIIFWLINYELILIGYLLTFLVYVVARTIGEWRMRYV